MFSIRVLAGLAIAIWVIASVACWPFSQEDSPAPATPDIQSTIDAAVHHAKQSAQGSTPTPTPDVQSTIQSLVPTVDAMVRALSGAPVPTATPSLPLSPSPTATAPPPLSSAPTPIPRPVAPLFSGQTVDGREFNVADTAGTPTLLVFWAPW